ncbi:hypothetical protein ACSSV1_002985, partial [Labrenzia sp. MBR-25]
PLEIVTEIARAHHGLLASKLGKKTSTYLGAIQLVLWDEEKRRLVSFRETREFA